MVRLHLELENNRNGPNDPEDQELVMETQDIYEEWRRNVEARGEARGRAEALLAVLGTRGVVVSAEQAARIRACRDLETLEARLRRAVAVSSCEDVLR